MKKRSKSDRSEIARDSNSEQKAETTVEFPEDGRTLFSINSKRSFSRDEFWGKPGRLFSLLAKRDRSFWNWVAIYNSIGDSQFKYSPSDMFGDCLTSF